MTGQGAHLAENAKFWHFCPQVCCIEKLGQGGLLVKFERGFCKALFSAIWQPGGPAALFFSNPRFGCDCLRLPRYAQTVLASLPVCLRDPDVCPETKISRKNVRG